MFKQQSMMKKTRGVVREVLEQETDHFRRAIPPSRSPLAVLTFACIQSHKTRLRCVYTYRTDILEQQLR